MVSATGGKLLVWLDMTKNIIGMRGYFQPI
ncbi:hypothetical protein RABR111495_03055 [Rahnella bruchi]